MWKCTTCETDNWDSSTVCHVCHPRKYKAEVRKQAKSAKPKSEMKSEPTNELHIFSDEEGRGYQFVNGHRKYLDGKPQTKERDPAEIGETGYSDYYFEESEAGPKSYEAEDQEPPDRDFGFLDRILHLFGLSNLERTYRSLEGEYRSLQRENNELKAKNEELEAPKLRRQAREQARWEAKQEKLEREKAESEKNYQDFIKKKGITYSTADHLDQEDLRRQRREALRKAKEIQDGLSD